MAQKLLRPFSYASRVDGLQVVRDFVLADLSEHAPP